MGYSDGRKQVRRILSIVERLRKVDRITVRDLANFYDIDITRIYDDLKIIKEFYELKRDRGLLDWEIVYRTPEVYSGDFKVS